MQLVTNKKLEAFNKASYIFENIYLVISIYIFNKASYIFEIELYVFFKARSELRSINCSASRDVNP